MRRSRGSSVSGGSSSSSTSPEMGVTNVFSPNFRHRPSKGGYLADPLVHAMVHANGNQTAATVNTKQWPEKRRRSTVVKQKPVFIPSWDQHEMDRRYRLRELPSFKSLHDAFMPAELADNNVPQDVLEREFERETQQPDTSIGPELKPDVSGFQSSSSNQDSDSDPNDEDEEYYSQASKYHYRKSLQLTDKQRRDTISPNVLLEHQVQDQLTVSVRRLVLGLEDSLKDESNQTLDMQENASDLDKRKRGDSCPSPFDTAEDQARRTSATASIHSSILSPPERNNRRMSAQRFTPKMLQSFPFRKNKKRSYLLTDDELAQEENARWKVIELAFRFGGEHRFYLVQALNMFFPLKKFGRRGEPHDTRLHCNHCGSIQWQHKRGALSKPVDLADVLQVLEGCKTAVFQKRSSDPALGYRCLSLILGERTIDLETASRSHRDWLASALRTLIQYVKQQRVLERRAIQEKSLLGDDDSES